MAKKEIAEIERLYKDLWRKMGHEPPAHGINEPGPRSGLETYQDVEFEGGKYRLLFTERGAPVHLQETKDKHQMLEWLAVWITVTLTHQHFNGAKRPRPNDQRAWLLHQIGLLEKVDPRWAANRRREFAALLGKSPT